MRSALASKVSNWKKKEKSESVKNSTPSLFSYCDFQIYMTFIAKSLHLMNTIIEIKLISYIKDAIIKSYISNTTLNLPKVNPLFYPPITI